MASVLRAAATLSGLDLETVWDAVGAACQGLTLPLANPRKLYGLV